MPKVIPTKYVVALAALGDVVIVGLLLFITLH